MGDTVEKTRHAINVHEKDMTRHAINVHEKDMTRSVMYDLIDPLLLLISLVIVSLIVLCAVYLRKRRRSATWDNPFPLPQCK